MNKKTLTTAFGTTLLAMTVLAFQQPASAQNIEGAGQSFANGAGAADKDTPEAREAAYQQHMKQVAAELRAALRDPANGKDEMQKILGDAWFSDLTADDLDYLAQARTDILGNGDATATPEQVDEIIHRMHDLHKQQSNRDAHNGFEGAMAALTVVGLAIGATAGIRHDI